MPTRLVLLIRGLRANFELRNDDVPVGLSAHNGLLVLGFGNILVVLFWDFIFDRAFVQ